MNAPDTDPRKAETPDSVVTECDLPDAPEKVWKALTAPRWLAAWLPEAIDSEILAAEPNRLLRYRWAGADDDKDAAGRPLKSIVTFELTGTPDGGTHLRVVHRVAEDVCVIPFRARRHTPVAMAARHRGKSVTSALLRWAA